MSPKQPWYRLTIRRAMALVVVAALVSLVPRLRPVESPAERARRAQCLNNLKQIALALHNYHSTWDCFPPAHVNGPDGTPWQSWRVLIGPYLESNPAWSRYNVNEPWDSPRNRLWIFPNGVYRCPTDHDALRVSTSYVVIVGPGTPFPGVGTTKLSDVRDGTSRTIAVVECTGLDIPWTEPRDLDISQLSFLLNDPNRPGPSSLHPAGVNVALVDGYVTTLKMNVTPAQLKAMLTIDGKD